MGIVASLRRESRAVNAQDFAYAFDPALISLSGEGVNRDTALAVDVFADCVRKKARAMSAMPVDAYRPDGDGRQPVRVPPAWLAQPNPDEKWHAWIARVSQSFDTDANAFLPIVRNNLGTVVEVYCLDPATVQVERFRGRKVYAVNGREFPGEMVHVVKPGAINLGGLRAVPVWQTNAETFGLALATQRYAATFFGTGGVPSGVIETDAPLDANAIEQIAKWWKQARRAKGPHAPGILTGARWKSTQVDVEKTQLVAVQQNLGVRIASLCDMPPVFVGLAVQGSSLTYQNVVDAWVDFVRKACLPEMEALQAELSALMPAAQRMRFRTEIFEKPDTAGRYAIYATGIQAGFITPDDVRAWEDLKPLPTPDTPNDHANHRDLNVAEVIQKIYLGVGTVITADEAREIVNSAGGNLTGSLPSPSNA